MYEAVALSKGVGSKKAGIGQGYLASYRVSPTPLHIPPNPPMKQFLVRLLTAFRNGGAGQPKTVALGVEDSLVKTTWCVAEGAWYLSADFGSSSAFGVLEPVALSLGLQDVAAVSQAVQCRARQPFAA